MKGHGHRRRRLSAALLAGASLLAALASHPARADGVADEAELHFQRGVELYQLRDFAGCLEHLMLSNRLVPNRNVVYNIARAFEQLHRFADAYRYYVDALTGETDPTAVKDINAALARVSGNVALLEVVTSPPGATIYVDRKDLGSRGRSPRPLALAAGQYQVIVEAEGYDPKTSDPVEVRLGASTKITLTLAPIVGTVHAEVEGPGAATVRADDPGAAPACTAPCDLKLSPGRHDLRFTRDGFQEAVRPVAVVARQTARVTAVLSPLTGSLIVSADERDALVSVDGRPMGFTPVVIQNIAAGRRKVRVTLRGYTPIDSEVVIQTGQQTALDHLELTPLREVTAVSRVAERIDDAPSSVSIVDARELSAFGYPTIAEALRGVRGVSISNDRVYSSAGIRGLGQPNDYGNRVLVLSDGQPLNDDLLNSSYIGSDARVDLHDIERIEVVRGPGSLLYGAGAFSGVINLMSRPRDEPNQVHAAVGTYDDAVVHGRAGFHYNVSPTAGVWASASAAHSEGVDLAIPLRSPGMGAPTQVAHGVDAFSSGGTAGRAWWGPFTMQWFYHQRDQIAPIGAYATIFDDPRTHFVDTRMMAELRYEPQLSRTVQLLAQAHVNRYTYHAFDAFPASNGDSNVEDFHGSWFGGQARLLVSPKPWLRLTLGGEGQVHPDVSLHGESVSGKTYLDERDPYTFAAGYAIVEASPRPWIRASAGARVDVYSTFGPIFVPRASVILKPSSSGVLKIMSGRAFRAPSIYEQFYNDGGISETRAVDPSRHLSLGAESVYSGEVEYSQRFLSDWVVLGAAHGSYIQGIISTIPDTPGSALVRYANSETPALVLGGDVELRREWRRGWMLAAMYGYQHAAYLQAAGPSTELINTPQHLASFRGVVPMVSEFASLALRMTLEAPRRLAVESSETTRAAVVMDVAISGSLRAYGLHYTVGVYNAADWRYQVPLTETFAGRTSPQNGRTFLVDLLATYP